MTITADALAHGAIEGGKRPATDARLFIRCDIGGVEVPKRRIHLQPPGIRRSTPGGVTYRAIPGSSHLPTAFEHLH